MSGAGYMLPVWRTAEINFIKPFDMKFLFLIQTYFTFV